MLRGIHSTCCGGLALPVEAWPWYVLHSLATKDAKKEEGLECILGEVK